MWKQCFVSRGTKTPQVLVRAREAWGFAAVGGEDSRWQDKEKELSLTSFLLRLPPPPPLLLLLLLPMAGLALSPRLSPPLSPPLKPNTVAKEMSRPENRVDLVMG